MQLVSIEANIGAGKSTLIEKLPEQLKALTGEDWVIIKEPVDEDPEFHRLLKQFIAEPDNADKRVEFQRYITIQRQGLLKDITEGNYIIERSLYSDLVFCQTYFLTAERPSAHYMDYYYDIKRRLEDYPQVDLVVYLDREPLACYDSIALRGREGEHYDLCVLQDLKRFHDACIPQIAREYGSKLSHISLGSAYADPTLTAVNICRELGHYK